MYMLGHWVALIPARVEQSLVLLEHMHVHAITNLSALKIRKSGPKFSLKTRPGLNLFVKGEKKKKNVQLRKTAVLFWALASS